jgi:hypothetical protein
MENNIQHLAFSTQFLKKQPQSRVGMIDKC